MQGNSQNKFIDIFYKWFPFALFIIFAQTLRRTHGHLRFKYLILLSLSVLIFLFFYKKFKNTFNTINVDKVFALAWLVLSFFVFDDQELLYAKASFAKSALKGLLSFNLICSIAYFAFEYLIPKEKLSLPIPKNYLLKFALSCLAIAAIVMPFVSPNPHIDVWVYAKLGADHVLSGESPYGKHYPDLYNGAYDLTHGFVYWPVHTILFSINKFFVSDVRWVLVIAHLLSLRMIFKFSKELQYSETQALIHSILWAAFPVTFFVIENSWVDVMSITLLVAHSMALFKGRIKTAGFLLGLIVASKQYMVFFPIFGLIYVVKKFDWKQGISYTCYSLLSAIIVFAPFLIWSFDEFIKDTFLDLMTLGARDDALSWVAYFIKHHNFTIPGKYTGIAYIASFIGLIIVSARQRITSLNTYHFSSIVMYSVVFLLGKQAFCNYYYMLSIVVLMFAMYFYSESNGSNNEELVGV